jgi:hypothetical protein
VEGFRFNHYQLSRRKSPCVRSANSECRAPWKRSLRRGRVASPHRSTSRTGLRHFRVLSCRGGVGEDLDLQLSVSKNRVLMSMKSFPNNERFWQYNWTLFSYAIRPSERRRGPYPSRRQPPISYELHVGKLSFLEGVCDRTSSMYDGRNITIQSRKSLAKGF